MHLILLFFFYIILAKKGRIHTFSFAINRFSISHSHANCGARGSGGSSRSDPVSNPASGRVRICVIAHSVIFLWYFFKELVGRKLVKMLDVSRSLTASLCKYVCS